MPDATSRPTSSPPTAPAGSDRLRQAWVWLIAGALAAAVIFTAWPGIDTWLSGLFYVAGKGFPALTDPTVMALRMVVWRLSILMAVLSLILLAWTTWRGPVLGLGPRIWGFVVLLYAIGPGLIVDGILKRFWGRARPADIVDFGGTAQFSPALFPSDQCARNCSFVSGEGSGAVAFAVASFVIITALGDRLPRALSLTLRGAALAVAATGSALRVVTGRHFLSDTVFAVLIVLAVALALGRVVLQRR